MQRFFSLLPSPPEGFTHCTPDKRALLSGSIALLSADVDTALALIANFHERVRGIILTSSEQFTRDRLGDHLWHFTITENQLPVLNHLASAALDILDHATGQQDKINALLSEMEYHRQHMSQTEEGYNRAMDRLGRSMEETRQENEKNRQLIAQLSQEIERLLEPEPQ